MPSPNHRRVNQRALSDEKVGAALTVPRPRQSDGKFALTLSIVRARDAVPKHRNFARSSARIHAQAKNHFDPDWHLVTAEILREGVMDHRRPIIRTIADAEDMHAQLLAGAANTAAWLRNFAGDPMALLKSLRFELVGHDPLTGEAAQRRRATQSDLHHPRDIASGRAVDRTSPRRRRLSFGTWHQQRPGPREHRSGYGRGRGLFRHAPEQQPKAQKGSRRVSARTRRSIAMCSLPRLDMKPAGRSSSRSAPGIQVYAVVP